jgi:hypothetical protein
MNVKELAMVVEPAAGHELAAAEELRKIGCFTESGLRLGRAVEASLYGTAREAGIQLKGTVIKELEAIRDQVRQRMVHLLRQQTVSEVRKLSAVSKNLSEAVANLASDPSRCAGTAGTSPRNNEQIFDDLVALTTDVGLKRRLLREKQPLHEVQVLRNRAAHASQEGVQQELTEGELLDLDERARRFIRAVLDVRIGLQAKTVFGPSATPAGIDVTGELAEPMR